MSVKNRIARTTIDRSRSLTKKKDSRIALAAAVGAMGMQLFPLFGADHQQARAAVYFWDPGNTPGNPSGGAGTWDLSTLDWSNGASDTMWTDTSAAGTDTAVFGGTAGTVLLNANLSALGIVLNTSGYDFTGTNTLTLGAGGINESASPNNSTDTFNAPILLGANQTWTLSSGSNITVNGPISDGNLGYGITETGAGTITLTAANTYVGGTTVNSGTLDLDFSSGSVATNIISASSALTLGSGTLLVNNGASSASPTQTFASTALNTGMSILQVTKTGTGIPTINLGAITPTANGGGLIEFIGPATNNAVTTATGQAAGGLVAATANITTTTGAANAILQGSAGAAIGAVFGTVGLYDLAAVSGTSPFTVIGLSQATGGSAGDGGYTVNNNGSVTMATGGNYDLMGATDTANHNTSNYGAIRFNAPGATTFSSGTSANASIGTLLVTPNVGANNITLSGTWQPGQRSSIAGGATAFWQNNTLGFLDVTAVIGNLGRTGFVSSIDQAGPGTVDYTGVNTYTGPSLLDGGISEINSNSALGAPATPGAVDLAGGTLVGSASFALDNAGSNPRPITLVNNGGGLAAVGGATLTVDGAITGTGALNIGYGTLPGTGAGTANTTAVTGGGTVILSGGASNTYSGGTNVNAGTLRVDTASNTGTGIVTINNGGTLMGVGAIATAVTNNSGGTIMPGDSNVIGSSNPTLTLGSLALNPNSVSNFNFNATGTHNSIIDVTSLNGLTFPGLTSLAFPGIDLIQGSGSFNVDGTYDLFDLTGTSGSTIGSELSQKDILFPAPNTIYSFGDAPDGSGGTYVTVTITGTAVNSQWNNTGSGNWNVSGNWTGGVPHQAGDVANFGSNPPGIIAASTVTLNVSETVGSILFNNTNAYTITPANGSVLTLDSGTSANASINDNGGTHTVGVPVTLNVNTTLVATNVTDSLVISGAISDTSANPKALSINPSGALGTVILSANNTGYYGAPTINGGTLQVGEGGATGSLGNYAGTITDKGTLAYDLSSSISVGNIISGSGVLQQAGSGIVTLTAANSFASTNITNGTLQIGNAAALGSAPIVNISSPGTLDVNGNNVTINAISGNGNIDNVSAGGTPTLTLSTGTFGGSIKNTTGTLALVMNTTGATLFLNGSNSTYSGATTISAGQIMVGNVGGTTGTYLGTGTVADNVADGILLGNGANLTSAITDGAGNNEFADVPVANSIATLSGNVTTTSNLRLGNSLLTSTLVLTGTDSGAGQPIFTRGNLVFTGNGSFTVTSGSALWIGRNSNTSTLNLTVEGNAVITANAGIDLGGANTSSDDETVNMTMAGNATVNSGPGAFDLNDNGNGFGTNLIIGGTSTLATSNFLFGSTIFGTTAVVELEGGTILANANDPGGSQFFPNFQPALGNNGEGLDVFNDGGGTINNNGHNITIAASISDGGGGSTDTMTYVGTGTTTVAADNSYNGDTFIGDGTHATTVILANESSGGSALGSSNTAHVLNNALLTGTGSAVGSTVAVNSGGHVDPGLNGVGTLSFGGLTLNTGSVLDYDFAGGATALANHDFIQLSTSFTINPGSGINLYNYPGSSSFATAGTYDLIDVSGGTSANVAADLTVLNAAASTTYSFSDVSDGSGGDYVQLVVATSLNFSQWNNTGSGPWGTSTNWTGGIPQHAGDEAIFGLNPPGISAPSTVTVGQTWTVGSIVFDNSNSYTIGAASDAGSLVLNSGAAGPATITDTLGTHTISVPVSLTSNASITIDNSTDALLISKDVTGVGGVTMNGAGTAILGANNSYDGATTVNSGTLQVGNGGATGTLGASAAGITDNGTLAFDTSANLSIANAITGTGAVTQSGSGTTTLTGAANSLGAVNVNAGVLQVGAAGAIGTAGNVTINGGMLDLDGNSPTIASLSGAGGSVDNSVAAATPTLTINGSGSTTYSGTIANSAAGSTVSLVKAGTGTQALSGTNTYTGTTAINAGVLLAGSNQAFGVGGTVTVAAINGLQLANGVTISNPISVSDGPNEFLDVPLGALTSASATLSGPVTSIGSSQFRLGTSSLSATVIMTGATNTTAAADVFITRGNVVYAGSSTWTSTVGIEVGRSSATASANLILENTAAITAGSFGLGGTGSANDDLNTSVTLLNSATINTGTGDLNLDSSDTADNTTTLTLDGTSNITTAGVVLTSVVAGETTSFVFNGGGLTASAANAVFLPVMSTATVSVGTSGGTINNGGFAITLAQPFVSGASPDGGLTFAGTGTTTITAANTYNGNSTLSAGTLVVDNTSGSALGSGAKITLNGGVLANVGSTGSFTGSVMAGSGSHTIAPGGVGTVGSLSLAGGLTTSSLTTLDFDLGTGAGPVVTNGDLLTLGSTITIGAGTTIALAGTPVGGEDYRLIGAPISGGLVGGINDSDFTVTGPAGFSYSLSNNSVDPGFIDVLATVSGPASLTWTNASSDNLWNTASSSNWNNGSATTVFHAQDNVTFNDNNPSDTSANYAVTLNTTVSPGSVTVNSTLGNYTISGMGTIGGTGSLTKSGTGTLTLSTPNTFSGGATVTAGRLLVDPTSATTSALPHGALSISGSGIVQLADNVAAGTAYGTSNVNLTTLSIAGNGTFDIGNNRVIIDYTAGHDPIASIQQWIENGYLSDEVPGDPHSGGGPSIISSDIAADDAASGLSYGIGYADGADGLVAGLPSGEIEIMLTLLGDANLDGTVNSEDFTPFSANLGKNGSWDDGDFNYDGTVNAEDFSPFSHNIGQSATLAAAAGVLEPANGGISVANVPEVANGVSLTNVPEPASTGLLTVGLVSILARRRRKTKV
jgi:fibronectin-binding autotransporter adhesin